MNTFLQELKKRRVYRVAIGYGVAASALVQVGGSVLATFHTPEWVQQVMVALLALGFPVALMLAWVFDMRDGMIQSPSTLHSSCQRPKGGRVARSRRSERLQRHRMKMTLELSNQVLESLTSMVL